MHFYVYAAVIMNMQDGAVLGNRPLAYKQKYFDNFFDCGYVMTGCSECPETSNGSGEQLLHSINVTMDFEVTGINTVFVHQLMVTFE